ncbi:MAG: hypothetical protein ACRDHZ_09430, partial [Ktedonobacteraceae bacterium]
LESLQETLEIMKDPELMAAIRQGMQDIEQGRTIAFEDVEKELDQLNAMSRMEQAKIATNTGEPLADVLKELGWE